MQTISFREFQDDYWHYYPLDISLDQDSGYAKYVILALFERYNENQGTFRLKVKFSSKEELDQILLWTHERWELFVFFSAIPDKIKEMSQINWDAFIDDDEF